MKVQKVITIITIILLVVIITLASFLGIYKKEEYRVSNKVPDYILGMEFTSSRVINLETNKEKNTEDVLTIQNYKQAKSIITNRLKRLNVDQYKVTLDESTGNIQVRIPENKDTDTIIYYLLQSGTFELKDKETKEILMDTNDVKKAEVVYSQGNSQTSVFLQIKFNKEAKQKLKEISNAYVKTEDVTDENNQTEEATETKSIELYLNGEMLTEVNPKEMIMNEMLYIGVGTATNSTTLEQYRIAAEQSAAILNSGVQPITYIETDNVESFIITREQTKICMYVTIGFIVLMVIIFIIRLKSKGILASILQIGYIGLLLLTLRYTNVKITIEGICGIVLGSIINFVYTYNAFRNIRLNFVKDVTAKFALRLIPIYIIAVVFSFNRIAKISSLGMTLVWGIIIMYLYNMTLTQITLNSIKIEQK